ncbi:MAG TPA: S8 family serine peptidase [bacterium]|nr:S8 family serine peptidase [bacterium]
MAAPLAWGCDTGRSSTPIAVVDNQFLDSAAVSDLAPNIHSLNTPNLFPNTLAHGTLVASVLGAVGNNGQGITGMMWRANLRLYESGVASPPGGATITPLGIANMVAKAAAGGARVVNLSTFQNWHGAIPNNSVDSGVINQILDPIVKALRTQMPAGGAPLLVVIAGNNGEIENGVPGHQLNAFWSGYPALADSFPNVVLVVGASDRSGQYPAFADTGRLVSVAAPGVDIPVLENGGLPVKEAGTSVSAPYVSGIAGLLVDFDSTLTTSDLRRMIIGGAIQGGRTAGKYPIVNAYESLKLAAQRSGAPLCGNRVWTTGEQVFAQRDTTSPTGEQIVSLPDSAAYINVFHGGHRLEALNVRTFGTLAFKYTDGSWTPTTDTATTPVGGAYLSLLQVSHDQDSFAVVTPHVTSGQETLDVGVFDTVSNLTAHLANLQIPLASGDTTCFWKIPFIDDMDNIIGFDCLMEGTTGGDQRLDWRYAFASYGGKILVAITKFQSTISSRSGPSPCPWGGGPIPDAPQFCVTATLQEVALGTDVYQVDIASKADSLLWSIPNKQVFWLAVSEDGTQIATAEAGVSQTTVFQPNPAWTPTSVNQGFEVQISGPQQINGCTLTWRSHSSGNVLLSGLSNPAACFQQGQGTIAPVRQAP